MLEYTSYVLCMQASAGSYYFEFTDFIKYIERSHEYADIPCPISATLYYLVVGMSFLGLFVIGEVHLPITKCWSDEFLQWPVWYRFVYYYFSFLFLKMRYDGAWNLITGNVMASGFGYNGRDKDTKRDRWDKIVLQHSFKILTVTSPMALG